MMIVINFTEEERVVRVETNVAEAETD